MPPRQLRSSIRSANPPNTQNSLPAFEKPNLPPLQGTPGSRRQYSYGAEVEPMPSRPGHGLRSTQPRDISSAVKSALVRPESEEGDHEDNFDSPQPQQHAVSEAGFTVDASMQQGGHQLSYLSGPSTFSGPGGPLASERIPAADDSEGDDARSFGLESDYYGDATIDSAPGALHSRLPARHSPSHDGPASESESPHVRLRPSNLNHQATYQGEDDVDLVRQPSPVRERRANERLGSSPLRSAPRRPPRSVAARLVENSDVEASDEERDESELDDLDREMGPRHVLSINTPAPRRTQFAQGQNPHKRTRLDRSLLPPPMTSFGQQQRFGPNQRQFGPTARKSSSRTHGAGLAGHRGFVDRRTGPLASEGSESSNDIPRPGRWLNRANATSNFSSLFAHAKFLVSSSPFRLSRRYPTDEREREAAIQRDIDAAEAEVAHRRRQREAGGSQQPWHQGWLWLKSSIPFKSPLQNRENVSSSADHEGSRTHAHLFLLRILNPWTYLKALAWIVETLLHSIMRVIHYVIPTDLWDRLSSVFGFLPHIVAGLLAFVLAFVLATQLAGSAEGGWIPEAIGSTWRTLNTMRQNIQEFVPVITWPRRDRWVELEDLWESSEATSDQVEAFLSRMEEEFLTLRRARDIQDASIKRLENVVPSIVHMELRNGRPEISQEFWHAMRDLLHGDGSFMAFNKVGREYEVSSERQWKAIASRMIRDPVLDSKLNSTLHEFEREMSGKMTMFWDRWVKGNDEKIAQMLGSAVDQVKSAGSQKEFEERLTKIVKEHLSLTKLDVERDQVVTRDEFLRHLRNELTSHRSEFQAELKDLRPQMEEMVKQSVELASNVQSSGMSRSDVTKLVKEVIREALGAAHLDALAKGSIHRHWDTDLRHQINHFAVGSGAVIDSKHSSATWDPNREGIVTQAQYEKGHRSGSKPLPPIAALDSWQEPGDCWCAARSINHRGNPHGASLAVQLRHRVIPQHIVVEHILSGATSDPGARPKLIEVWAAIHDARIREILIDFGAVFLPDDLNDWNFTPPEYPEHFVKISQFTYEAVEAQEGVHVHRLSSELMGLGADTDHVILRAVSNHGSENHTCFYRVRLYGASPDSESESWP